MQTLGEIIPTIIPSETPATRQNAPSTSASKSLQSETQKNWQTQKLKESLQARNEMTRLLSQAFSSQKTYGDKAEMMEYRDAMFQMILADECIADIRKAFISFIKKSPDLPTPSDIMKLCEEAKKLREWQARKPENDEEMYKKLSSYIDKGIPLSPAQARFYNSFLGIKS